MIHYAKNQPCIPTILVGFSSISPWHHGGFRRIVAEVVINTHHEAWLKEHYDGSKYLVERGITTNGAKRMK